MLMKLCTQCALIIECLFVPFLFPLLPLLILDVAKVFITVGD